MSRETVWKFLTDQLEIASADAIQDTQKAYDAAREATRVQFIGPETSPDGRAILAMPRYFYGGTYLESTVDILSVHPADPVSSLMSERVETDHLVTGPKDILDKLVRARRTQHGGTEPDVRFVRKRVMQEQYMSPVPDPLSLRADQTRQYIRDTCAIRRRAVLRELTRYVRRQRRHGDQTIDMLIPYVVNDKEPPVSFRAYERRTVAAEWQEALTSFRAYLDPDLLADLARLSHADTTSYCWLAGSGDPVRSRYRRQALHTYPIMDRLLTSPDVTEHIDHGISPPAAIAREYKPPFESPNSDRAKAYEQTVRKLNGVAKSTVPAIDPENGLQDLSRVPSDWWPRGRDASWAFLSVMRLVEEARFQTDFDTKTLLKGTRGNWEQIRRQIPDQPVTGLQDLLRDATKQLLLPALAREAEAYGVEIPWYQSLNARRSLAPVILGRRNLLALQTANQRYHDRITRIANAPGYAKPEISWPALSQSARFEVDDQVCWVVPLTRQSDLSQEAAIMQNCLGGYTDRCLNGSHILSVRNEDGRVLADAEITEQFREDNDEPDLALRQVLGEANTRAPAAADKAVFRYVDWIRKPENMPDVQGMTVQRNATWKEMKQGATKLHCGFDPLDLDAQEAVFQEWRPVMTGPGRRCRTYGAFLEHLQNTGTIENIIERPLDLNELVDQGLEAVPQP